MSGGSSGTAAALAGADGSIAGTTSGACNAGDTRQCVGPAACRGGQTCGGDGRWGVCDCGQATGGQGGGGASNNQGGVNSPASGGAPDDTQETSGAGGATSDNVDAAGAGNFTSSGGDEPCPADAITADCSGQCSATDSLCSSGCPVIVNLQWIKAGEIIARTPSQPGANCGCGQTMDGYWLTIRFKKYATGDVHVSVPAPWHVMEHNGKLPLCELPAPGSCASFSDNEIDNDLEVWTTDPGAPAANLLVESGICP